MNKETHVILPEYASEIISEILEEFNLKAKDEEIYEKISKSSDSKTMIALKNDLPSMKIASMARRIKEDGLPDKEASLIISEQLGLDKKKADEMVNKIQKKLVAFSKIVQYEEDESEKVKKPEKKSFTEEFLSTKEEFDESSFEPKDPDPYREIIE